MAYDGTLKFDTAIDAGGFQKGIDGIGSIAAKGMQATGAILMGAASAIGAMGAAAIKVGADFEGWTYVNTLDKKSRKIMLLF